jgi:hypothetical protein
MNHMKLIIALGLAILVAAGAPFFRSPVQTAITPKAPPQENTKTELTVETFPVPGRGGKPVMARFRDLDRLPSTGDDFCPLLKNRLAKIPEQPAPPEAETTDRRSIESLVDLACGGPSPGTKKPVPMSQRGYHAGLAALLLDTVDKSDAQDVVLSATMSRWVVSQLRKAQTVEQARDIIFNTLGIKPSNNPVSDLSIRRFNADLQRLQADVCSPDIDPYCRERALVEAGDDYARLGRLSSDEMTFRDMAEALDEAEPLVRNMADRDQKISLLDDIATAYGYAGEDGRDRALLERAVQISERNVAELEAGKDGNDIHAYDSALRGLGSNLARLAGYGLDKARLTLRAIETHEKSIAHGQRHFPGNPSWDNYINLAADQRDMFALTREQKWIDAAISNARRALEIYGEEKSTDRLYIRLRLAQALAWQAKHGKDIADDNRKAMFREAQSLLDEAEPAFHALNTQSYLKIIANIRPLLPKQEEKTTSP